MDKVILVLQFQLFRKNFNIVIAKKINVNLYKNTRFLYPRFQLHI